MQTFKQYLTESPNLLPDDKSKLLDELNEFYYTTKFLLDWFYGDFMGKTAPTAEQDRVIRDILDIRKKLQNYEFENPTLYRIFPEYHLEKILTSNELKKYNSIKAIEEKKTYLNSILDGREVSLNTGLMRLQSWTDDYQNTIEFRSFLNKKPGKVFLDVQSSFNETERLFFYPNVKKIGEYIKQITPELLQKASDYNFPISYIKPVISLHDRIVNDESGFSNERESLVDATLPKRVVIKDIYIS
jgi:hypothetical protein